MFYYEITITVFAKKNIPLDEVGEKQGRFIKNAMKHSAELSELHIKRGVKLYCFDYLFPRAEGKLFLKDRVYYFKLRTPIESTAKEFARVISDFENDTFKVVARQIKKKTYYPKLELYTSTPAICTLGNKYWKREDGIELIEEKIEKNLVTKYKALYGEEPALEKGFIKYIELKNEKPIKVKYKEGSMVGNKFNIEFKADEITQKMEYIAYTTSILEKASSIGSGFCI